MALSRSVAAALAALLAVPASGQPLFWAESPFSDAAPGVYRADADGSRASLVVGPVPFTAAVLDPVGGRVYGRDGDGVLRRARLDGSALEPLGPTDVRMLLLDPGARTLYWLDRDDRIRRSDLDGANAETVATGASPFRIDLENGVLVWRDVASGAYVLSELDGSDVRTLHTPAAGEAPTCTALDPVHRQVYWLDFASREPRRVGYDGTGFETVDLTSSGCVVVDGAAGMLYWQETAGVGRVLRRGDLDGANAEDLLTVDSFVNGLTLEPAGGHLYWSTRDAVERAALDGSGRQTLASGFQPSGFALSPEADVLLALGASIVRRSALDGADPATLFGGVSFPVGLAVDAAAGRVFWSDFNESSVSSASFDGGDVRQLAETTPRGGLAVDPVAQDVYWVDGSRRIWRVGYDGTDPEEVLAGAVSATAVAVDAEARRLYWAGADAIERAALDGSGREVVVAGAEDVEALALDPTGQRVYWAANDPTNGSAPGTVSSAALGSGDGGVLVSGLPEIHGLAVDGVRGALYWSLADRTIHRAALDGAGDETIATGREAFALAVAAGLGDTAAEADAPASALALAAFPNPAARALTVAFDLGASGAVRVEVVDVLGRRVAGVHDGPLASGPQRLVLDVGGLASGAYVVRAVADGAVGHVPVTVVR